MKIIIDNRALKSALDYIAFLYKGRDKASAVCFSVEDGIFRIIGEQSVLFQHSMTVNVQEADTATVMFMDVSSLLPTDGFAEIEIVNNTVNISSSNFGVLLLPASSLLYAYAVDKERVSMFNAMNLINLESKLRYVSSIAKLFKTDIEVYFDGDYANIYFSTIWLRHRGVSLNTTLTIENIRRIARFNPTGSYTEEDALIFTKNSKDTILVIPLSKKKQKPDFEEALPRNIAMFDWKIGLLRNGLKAFNNTVKDGIVSLALDSEGVTKILAERGTLKAFYVSGYMGDIVFMLNIPIEYIILILGFIDTGEVKIGKDDNKVWIQGRNTDILMSVRD
ncbi:MAG: hypothetical protein LBS29_04755 [Endomicrobium sp.]|jgi:hypothetical protein|nr:hypothetical protein [Endomicrobium sp.]